MTRIIFAIGARVRHRASGQIGTVERPMYPDHWWVSWREGGQVIRKLYRGPDLELVSLGTPAVDRARDQTATPPDTYDATPLTFDTGSSSDAGSSGSSSDASPDTGGGGGGGGGDFGGGGASGEW